MRDYTHGKHEAPATETNKKKSANVTRRVAVGIGSLGILGSALYTGVHLRLIPNPVSEPTPEPEPEPDVEEPTFQTKVDAGTYTVGETIEAGLWSGYRFATDTNTYLSIKRGNDVYDLAAPDDATLKSVWANQNVLFELIDGDVITTTGTIEKVTDAQTVRNLELIPALKAGLISVGTDIEAGEWVFTPLSTVDYLDVEGFSSEDSDTVIEPYTVPDLNQSWNGRIYGLITEELKSQNLTKQSDVDRFQGLLMFDENAVSVLDTPFFLADIEYPDMPEVEESTEAETDADTDNAVNDNETAEQETPKLTEDTPDEAPAEETTTAPVATAFTRPNDAYGFEFILDAIGSPYYFVPIHEETNIDLLPGDFILPLFVTGKTVKDNTVAEEETDTSNEE